MAAGSGNQMAAVKGRGHIRASDADREQVIDALKEAFVRGRLSKDELTVRTGRALASKTYADLTAVTADILVTIPAWLTEARPAKPGRVPARKPVNKKAVAWTTCMIVLPPMVWAAFLTYSGGFIILFLLTFAGLMATTGRRTMPWTGASASSTLGQAGRSATPSMSAHGPGTGPL